MRSGDEVAAVAMLLELHDTQRELEGKAPPRDRIEERIPLDAAMRERDALSATSIRWNGRGEPARRNRRAST